MRTTRLLRAATAIAFSTALAATGCKPSSPEGSAGEAALDQRVDSLLALMTIDEKIGQMCQVNMNMITVDGYGSKDGTLHPDSVAKAVNEYKVGSLLNAVPSALPLEKWHTNIKMIQDAALKNGNPIPVLYGIDAIHGTTYTQNSTLFPHNIGLAATRNPKLVKDGAKVTAAETRASGIRWNFDPVLDIGRQPLWPRFEETFGEDVYVVTQMGAATIEGYEEDGLENTTAVASCMKHFVGYSAPRSGKDRTPSYIPEIELRELYLPQFQKAVDVGASTVMINSGEVNGTPVHASKFLLTDVLRGELGFEGLIVTDWEDIERLDYRHHVAKDQKEAVEIAINAGIDMSMVPHNYAFITYLKELVAEGKISEERINESVRRILKLKFKLGLFENPGVEPAAVAQFGKAEYKAKAKQAALESITLLENDTVNGQPVLPIRAGQRVLVCGPGANSITALNGSWSYLWQGNNPALYPEGLKTISMAMKDASTAPSDLDRGFGLTVISTPNFAADADFQLGNVSSAARSADVIVLCLGEDAYAESPGVIDDLMLPQNQRDLLATCLKTGKPVVVVITEGRPRVLGPEIEKAAAVVMAYRPGSQGGEAITDVLLGKFNPGGRLPFSYPRFTGDIVTYDRKGSEDFNELAPGATLDKGGYKPQWPFGHGLSYGRFVYSNLSAGVETFGPQDTLMVSVEVKNTGSMDGWHTVEVYSRDMVASVTPSMRRLRGFQKVMLKAGESKTVTFPLTASDLSFINSDMQRVTEPGDFLFFVGDQQVKVVYGVTETE